LSRLRDASFSSRVQALPGQTSLASTSAGCVVRSGRSIRRKCSRSPPQFSRQADRPSEIAGRSRLLARVIGAPTEEAPISRTCIESARIPVYSIDVDLPQCWLIVDATKATLRPPSSFASDVKFGEEPEDVYPCPPTSRNSASTVSSSPSAAPGPAPLLDASGPSAAPCCSYMAEPAWVRVCTIAS
jgi:hypothetical protein